MNMFDPFDPMSPFFHDEFIFNEDEPRRRREDNVLCRQACPHCGNYIIFRENDEIIQCNQCGSRFRCE